MRTIVAAFLALSVAGCGTSKAKKSTNIAQDTAPKAELAGIDWLELEVTLKNLEEDSNRLNPSGISREDHCFKLAHVRARTEMIGKSVEESARKSIVLSDEQKEEIADRSMALRLVGSFDKPCTDAELDKSFSKDIAELRYLLPGI